MTINIVIMLCALVIAGLLFLTVLGLCWGASKADDVQIDDGHAFGGDDIR